MKNMRTINTSFIFIKLIGNKTFNEIFHTHTVGDYQQKLQMDSGIFVVLVHSENSDR